MKKAAFILSALCFAISLATFAQEEKFTHADYTYFENDSVINLLRNIIENKIHNSKILSDSIILFTEKQTSVITKKNVIHKYFQKMINNYQYTDFVILRHCLEKQKYLIYNHCYMHKIMVNNKKQIEIIMEIENPNKDNPCAESKIKHQK